MTSPSRGCFDRRPSDALLWPQFVFTKLVEYLGVIGIVVAAGLLVVAWFMFAKNTKAWEVAAGAPEE